MKLFSVNVSLRIDKKKPINFISPKINYSFNLVVILFLKSDIGRFLSEEKT